MNNTILIKLTDGGLVDYKDDVYYDVYYNGDVDNIDEGSSDLILELRPKTTEVPEQEESYSTSTFKTNHSSSKRVTQNSAVKPKPTTTNNTDNSDPNSPLNAFPTN